MSRKLFLAFSLIVFFVACATTKTDVSGDTFREKRYEVIDLSMTWSEAKIYCESLGGHLVTIASPEEQEEVFSLIQEGSKAQYWLGGNVRSNGNWEWVTGEEWGYTNWATGQPDTYRGTEGFLQIYRLPNPYPVMMPENVGKWNDITEDNTIQGEEDFFSLNNVGIVCEYE